MGSTPPQFRKKLAFIRQKKVRNRIEMERSSLLTSIIYPEKIKLDDFLELVINDEKIIQVGGIYADYGNPHNQLMMEQTF